MNILFASTLNLDMEIQAIEGLWQATYRFDWVQIRLRSHPIAKLQNHPMFDRIKDRIEISSGLLVDDIDNTDLVVISYSTVGEEAILRGKPVWQWLPNGFNGSALANVLSIPQFGSVSRLRRELLLFRENPSRYRIQPKEIAFVEQELFFHLDGHAAERIMKNYQMDKI